MVGSKRVPPGSRKSPSPLARTELPSVESSLDAFIARANENVLDEPYVTAESREASLLREVGALKSQLAAAEMQAAPTRSSRRWGAIVVAFVAGCATMFAYGALAPRHDDPPKATAATAPSPPALAPSESHVTVTPIATAPPGPAAVPEPVAVPEPAAAPPPSRPTRVTTTTRRPAPAHPPSRETPTAAPAPPAPSKPAGSGGFYDPF